MFGALGRARGDAAVMFVSQAGQAAGVKNSLGLEKTVLAVQGTDRTGTTGEQAAARHA